jgi:hypothetical protein
MRHPTILRLPEWFGEPEQILLPLPAADYLVQQVHSDWWHVVAKQSGKSIYSGVGPISLEGCTTQSEEPPTRGS